MARVTVPDGCTGLTMEDGQKYRTRAGGRVDVDDRHAAAIGRHYGPLGIMSGREVHTFGTKATRTCEVCRPVRHWNAWSICCPRCGAPTTLFEE